MGGGRARFGAISGTQFATVSMSVCFFAAASVRSFPANLTIPVRACVCVRTCVCACVRACVCVCVCECVSVFYIHILYVLG
jgi:hypothetical protein